ncbi:MAG TPA: hypothetical protein VGE74_19305 [Gemmata sp.]
MAQRHTVFLKRGAAHVTADQVLRSIRDVGWDLVAEACDVPRARIGEADEHLRVEWIGPPGVLCCDLYYRPGDHRPVRIEGWKTADIAAGVIEEVIENLDPKARGHAKVRAFLEGCVDTVSASYGSARGEEMAPILGSQVCLWLAQEFDGIVRDPRGDWYEPTDGLDFKRL